MPPSWAKWQARPQAGFRIVFRAATLQQKEKLLVQQPYIVASVAKTTTNSNTTRRCCLQHEAPTSAATGPPARSAAGRCCSSLLLAAAAAVGTFHTGEELRRQITFDWSCCCRAAPVMARRVKLAGDRNTSTPSLPHQRSPPSPSYAEADASFLSHWKMLGGRCAASESA